MRFVGRSNYVTAQNVEPLCTGRVPKSDYNPLFDKVFKRY